MKSAASAVEPPGNALANASEQQRTISVAQPALLKGAVVTNVSVMALTSLPNVSTMPRTRSRKFSFASSSDPAASCRIVLNLAHSAGRPASCARCTSAMATSCCMQRTASRCALEYARMQRTASRCVLDHACMQCTTSLCVLNHARVQPGPHGASESAQQQTRTLARIANMLCSGSKRSATDALSASSDACRLTSCARPSSVDGVTRSRSVLLLK
jgi:hypothetical protein